MANLILGEDFNYDYNGTLLTEVFFKPSVGTPALTEFARIIPGSQFKIQIPQVGILSKIVKGGKGCITTETGEQINLENTTVELDPMRMRVSECAEDFETAMGNILAEEWLKSGLDRNDISGTELQTTINRLLEDALRRDYFRIFSFGDKNAASDDYDQTDGLWTRLIADSGQGGSYCVRRSSSVLGTAALSDGEALAALKATYEESDNILDQIPLDQKRFFVTRSIYDNLVSSYESVSTGSDLQVTYNQEGIPTVRYRGVLLVKVASWDDNLADTDNPLNGTTSHLILYTIRDNHVIGVGNTSDLNRIDGWYDKTDDCFFFANKARMGYNYVHCDLQTISY